MEGRYWRFEMHCTRKITDDLYYVGGSDRRLEKFENLFPIERGVSYNSYLFLDEKTCLLDTVDSSITRLYLENVKHVLSGRKLDYLVVHHMEPDHCANIEEILVRHPETTVVGNDKTFAFIRQFYPDLDLEGRKLVVKEGDVLKLGKHELHFFMAPMVHWPEVMVSYDPYDKVLFSADAFGTFGALNGNLFADEVNFDRDFLDDARRYYTNIVGKYGVQVQMALKKLAGVDIQLFCSLHGPVWRKDIAYLMDKYQHWSTYTPEEKGVMIVYGSMYGDNENVAECLATLLSEEGVHDVRVYDASKTTPSVLVGEAFRLSNIVFVTPTYNMTIYPAIEIFVDDLLRMGLKNRTLTLIENGTWAPMANRLLREKLKEPAFRFTPHDLTVRSSLDEEKLKELASLAKEIKESL